MSTLAVVFLATVTALMSATASGFVNSTTPQMYALAFSVSDEHEYWRTATSEHLSLVCSVL